MSDDVVISLTQYAAQRRAGEAAARDRHPSSAVACPLCPERVTRAGMPTHLSTKHGSREDS